jgi:AAA domain
MCRRARAPTSAMRWQRELSRSAPTNRSHRALAEKAKAEVRCSRRHSPNPLRPAWPAPLYLEALATREPKPPAHIIPGCLPEDEVTLFAGHGGAGKSAIALYTAVCIALGHTWYGDMQCERRRVLYISAEDGENVLHWRLSRICVHLHVDMRELIGWLNLVDAAELDAELMVETQHGTYTTPMYDMLATRVRETGAQVLVLDGASDLYGASEIIRRDVRRFIRAARRLIPADGAVLLLSHVDKAIARGRESGDHYSGSTAWNNSVRARWALRANGGAWARAGKGEPRAGWCQDPAQMGSERPSTRRRGIARRWRNHREHPRTHRARGHHRRNARLRRCRDPCPGRADWIAHDLSGAFRTGVLPPPELRNDEPAVRRRFRQRIEQLRASRVIEERLIRASHRHEVAVLVLVPGA